MILLVEDNPDDEALTRRALAKNNIQHEVRVARDGAEALDLLFGNGAYAGHFRFSITYANDDTRRCRWPCRWDSKEWNTK